MKKLILSILLVSSFISYSQKELIIQKQNYIIHYSIENKVPIYTQYYFTEKNRKKNQVAERSAGFKQDPLVPSDKQATNKDYARPYDKGHLTPDDDMKFSTDAEKETMIFTNCAPQFWNFNEVLWRKIENYVRDLGEDYDTLNVITGIIVDSSSKYIGNKIMVPTYYYKAIQIKMNGRELNTIGFICTNKEPLNTTIENFTISVNKLEKSTKIKMFDNSKYKDNNVLIIPHKDIRKKNK